MKSNPIAPSISRLIRRANSLVAFFADQFKLHGWKRATTSTARELVLPRLQARAQVLRKMVKAYFDTNHEVRGSRPGVLFIGYAEGALGLGQAFRANLKAAEAAGLQFSVYPFRSGIETRMLEPYMADRYDFRHAHDINVIEVAADQVSEVFRVVSPKIFLGTYNILCTYWELPRAPEAWRQELKNIHEIWAPNQFIANAFSDIFEGPITIIPPAMESTLGDHPGRGHFGMDEDRLYFMFSFDYYSSPFRKNPMGVLRAFRRAFPDGDENVGLVIKSTGSPDHFPDIKAEIATEMALDARIKTFDLAMSRDEMLGLIQSSDVYVSLHRAEGFGLGMAEAMTFGRIVIGTNYSGSMDFLNEETGYPIPYALRPVAPHEYAWSEGQVWAEPDEQAAAEAMREIAATPHEARRRAAVGRASVLACYSPQAVGKEMKKRLDVLLKCPPRSPVAT